MPTAASAVMRIRPLVSRSEFRLNATFSNATSTPAPSAVRSWPVAPNRSSCIVSAALLTTSLRNGFAGSGAQKNGSPIAIDASATRALAMSSTIRPVAETVSFGESPGTRRVAEASSTASTCCVA